jgi:hypothetical protein
MKFPDMRARRHSVALMARLLMLVVCSPALVCAQSATADASPVPATAHRFFDAANIALGAAETTALLADGIYTQRLLQKYPDSFREGDPIARPFVNAGWPGQIVGGTLLVSLELGLRYWAHRTDHHRLERLIPLGVIAYGMVGAIVGARDYYRLETTQQLRR